MAGAFEGVSGTTGSFRRGLGHALSFMYRQCEPRFEVCIGCVSYAHSGSDRPAAASLSSFLQKVCQAGPPCEAGPQRAPADGGIPHRDPLYQHLHIFGGALSVQLAPKWPHDRARVRLGVLHPGKRTLADEPDRCCSMLDAALLP